MPLSKRPYFEDPKSTVTLTQINGNKLPSLGMSDLARSRPRRLSHISQDFLLLGDAVQMLVINRSRPPRIAERLLRDDPLSQLRRLQMTFRAPKNSESRLDLGHRVGRLVHTCVAVSTNVAFF